MFNASLIPPLGAPVLRHPRNQKFFLASLLSASLWAASAHAAIVWQDGWENAAGTTCNNTGTSTDNIMDAGNWNEYGPSSTCTDNPPITTLSTTEHNSGNRSLQVHFQTGDGANGPDFRMNKVLAGGANRTDTYFREYIKWDANWQWAGADHKTAIFGSGNEASQDVYINVRGQNGGGAVGRLAIYTPTDTFFSDTVNGLVVPGQWNLIEAHIRSGSNGAVEIKLNGVLLNLTVEAGNAANPSNLNTGSGVGYFKIDTTYNDFAFFESHVSGGSSNAYYDDVAICDSWCGPAGTVTPPPPPPPTTSACDVNQSGGPIDVSDVQQCVNRVLKIVPCVPPVGDINQDGTCTVVDVQRVVNAALGGTCVTTP